MSDFITVKAGSLPGKLHEVVLNGDRTAQAALSAAGIEEIEPGMEIKRSGEVISLNTTLNDGDIVLVVEQHKSASSN